MFYFQYFIITGKHNSMFTCYAPSPNSMYSDFMSWMMKTILGIGADIAHPGFTQVEINPYFFRELTYARGYCGTVRGRIGVAWKRTSDRIELTVEVPEGMTVTFRGQTLKSGVNVITA